MKVIERAEVTLRGTPVVTVAIDLNSRV
jgi:hypothetical protein